MKSEDIRDRLKDIDKYLLNQYRENKRLEKRDWRIYEQQLTIRIKGAIQNLEPLINEAVNIKIHRGSGRPPLLDLKQRVIILLLKELIGETNRKMASMLTLFFLLSGIDVNYKKVERFIRIMMSNWQYSTYTG